MCMLVKQDQRYEENMQQKNHINKRNIKYSISAKYVIYLYGDGYPTRNKRIWFDLIWFVTIGFLWTTVLGKLKSPQYHGISHY
jgi:hypothetical protein